MVRALGGWDRRGLDKEREILPDAEMNLRAGSGEMSLEKNDDLRKMKVERVAIEKEKEAIVEWWWVR